jgi:hypothetical protein
MTRLELLRSATQVSAILSALLQSAPERARRVPVAREDLCDAANFAESLKEALEDETLEIATIVTDDASGAS